MILCNILVFSNLQQHNAVFNWFYHAICCLFEGFNFLSLFIIFVCSFEVCHQKASTVLSRSVGKHQFLIKVLDTRNKSWIQTPRGWRDGGKERITLMPKAWASSRVPGNSGMGARPSSRPSRSGSNHSSSGQQESHSPRPQPSLPPGEGAEGPFRAPLFAPFCWINPQHDL